MERQNRANLTDHANRRLQQRGSNHDIVGFIIKFADLRKNVKGGLLSLKVSRKKVGKLILKKEIPASTDKLLLSTAILMDPRTSAVITVIHLNRRGGRRYTKGA